MAETPRADAALGRRLRRRTRWGARAWFAVSVALLVLFGPVVLALMAGHVVASPVSAPLAVALPPMPEPRAEKSATLDGLIDPLPLVVRDLPDPASRRTVEAYDAATLLEPQSAADAFDAAWSGLVYPPEAEVAVAELGGFLLWGPMHASSAREALYGSTVPAAEVPNRFTFTAVAGAAMPALAEDPQNAERLSNAAVALVALGAASREGSVGAAIDGLAVGESRDAAQYGYRALALLQETDRAFGPRRAILLNLGYFLSLAPASRWSIDHAIVPVARQLAADPSDRTARLLLGSLQARQEDAAGALERALATLQPLAEDRATAPLGEAALGDAYLASATTRAVEAPYVAAELARRAIDAYDRALVASSDPGLYAGRASAFAFLADHYGGPTGADNLVAAVAAQRQAVELAPGSVGLRLGLALLLERSGDAAATREAARQVLALVDTGWNPPLREVRYLADPNTSDTVGDRGFLGTSYGSDRDHAVPSWEVGARAGVYVSGLGLIPRTEDHPSLADRQRADPAPVVALALALGASAALGDPAGVEGDLARWEASVARSRMGEQRSWALDATIGVAQPAAELVAGGARPSGDNPVAVLAYASNGLRRAGRFADAFALCERVHEEFAGVDPAHSADTPEYAVRVKALWCAGEAAFHAGQPALAAAALARAADFVALHPPTTMAAPLPLLRLRASAAAHIAGDTGFARTYSALVVAGSSDRLPRLAGLTQLGDLAMDAGEPAAAAAHYDVVLAEAALPQPDLSLASADAALEAAGRRSVARHAQLNRGVARLWRAQAEPGSAPDCATHRGTCLEARDDFAAALSVDGQDPVALLNAAWAARLSGDDPAARALLERAVAADRALAPGWNDLGVLAARVGDRAGARRAFEAALALDRGYDLAAWNLGILESAGGLAGWLPGQAMLARAIAETPALGTVPPSYVFDDRVYRMAVGAGSRAAEERTIGEAYGFGAAALGSVAALFGAGFVLGKHVTDQIAGAITDLGQEPLRRAASALGLGAMAGARRTALERRWWALLPWVATLPALALTTAWTAWQGRGDLGGGALASALAAAAVAVLGHELAHGLAARGTGTRVDHAAWGPGVALSLLLLPAGMSSGPYAGQRVRGRSANVRWWAYLAGPLCSAALAGVALALFAAQPLPFLRVLASAHLAVAAYALLPFAPLDGAALGRRRPVVLAGLGLVVSTAGLALALGVI